MAEDERFKAGYFDREISDRGYDLLPPAFLETIETWDTRLPLSTLCFGVHTEGGARAYPIHTLRHLKCDVVNDVVGGIPVVIIFDSTTGSAAGHGRVLDGNTLRFERSIDGLLLEQRSQSVFDRDGRAIAGKYKGRRLPLVHGLQTEWYGWYAAYPATSVYGETDSEKRRTVWR